MCLRFSQHLLALMTKAPTEANIKWEGIKRDVPPPHWLDCGNPSWECSRGLVARYQGRRLIIYLDPELIARVATTTFELDLSRTAIPPLDAFILPELRTTMLAVNAELTAGRRVERAQHLLRGADERLGGGRPPGRLLGPKPVQLSLQADRRHHAGTVSALPKNLLKEGKLRQEIGR
jgi:hypothetical protein